MDPFNKSVNTWCFRDEPIEGSWNPSVDRIIDNDVLKADYNVENFQDIFHFVEKAIFWGNHGFISDRLKMAFLTCQSPIEARFLAGFLCLVSSNQVPFILTNNLHDDFLTINSNYNYPQFIISPQNNIGEYKVDFLISCIDIIPDHDNPVKSKSGMIIPGSKEIKNEIIVECDGHDFHEKTKKQAAKDKKRDRELQSLGFHIFRFTGSEIWKDPIKCAIDVYDFICEF